MQDAVPPQQPPELAERPKSFLGGQGKLIIAMTLLVVALGYFAFTAFQGATVFYLTVGELLEGEGEVGETIRVSGKLVQDSFHREGEGTLAKFNLTDGQSLLPSIHDGVLPDLFFNEHSEIVLQGYYSEDGVFQSQMVVVKCPSKYASLAKEQRGETS